MDDMETDEYFGYFAEYPIGASFYSQQKCRSYRVDRIYFAWKEYYK
jgi:hypothetical protein